MSLRRKSILTALTKVINIALSFAVQIVITPFILNSLGKELFGVFTLINKTQNYLGIFDFRPTAILRYKIAASQTKNNIKSQREYIGSAFIVACIMIPFMVFFGWLISVFFDQLFIIDEQYVAVSKLAIIILSIFMGLKGILGIPEAIVRGNNAEYKLFFVEPLRLVFYTLFIYLFLKLGYGLMGVVISIILAGVIDFLIKLGIKNKLYPLFKPLIPKNAKIKEFFSKGTWYLLSSISTQIINTFDLIIIGVMIGAKAVTVFALTKSMLFRISESFSVILGSITASIGYLISNDNNQKLIELRYKLLRYNLIAGTLIVGYFILFNRSFVSLWVDSTNYAGKYANLFLCLGALFTLLSLSSEIFINSFQQFKRKSIILFFVVFVFTSSTLVFIAEYGLIGIALSLGISKFIQCLLYEFLLQKFIPLKISNVFFQNFVTIILLLTMGLINQFYFDIIIESWFTFIVKSCLYFIILITFVLIFVLNKTEKKFFYNLLKIK